MSSSNSLILISVAMCCALVGGCRETEPSETPMYAAPNRTIETALGQEVALTVQTVGPGFYDSIPTISSLALRFLSSASVGTPPPAGPTLRFRFRAATTGTAVVVFRFNRIDPALPDRTLQDTVIVR